MKQCGLIVVCILLLCGCKPQFEKIDYGKESCSHCKMTIVDKRFAAEMITSKGRTHKFDDVLCMKQYADYYTEQSKDAMYFVAVCNSNSEEFTDATKALYLQHQAFKSPMNGNYGAFSSTESAAATVKELNTQPVSWSDIK